MLTQLTASFLQCQPVRYRQDPETGGTGAGAGQSGAGGDGCVSHLCGMLLLLARVQVGMRQRHQELVVWRTLGAGKKLLRTTIWCEHPPCWG